MVSSAEEEAMLFPSGEKSIQVTVEECPSKLFISLKFTVSQILIISSLELEAKCYPSGEKLTQVTIWV